MFGGDDDGDKTSPSSLCFHSFEVNVVVSFVVARLRESGRSFPLAVRRDDSAGSDIRVAQHSLTH